MHQNFLERIEPYNFQMVGKVNGRKELRNPQELQERKERGQQVGQIGTILDLG